MTGDSYTADLREQEARLDAIDTVYQEVKDQRDAAWQEYRETVVGALEDLQDEIEDPVTLLEVSERGRMRFEYEERLTPDGIESGDGFNDWDGAVEAEEYLEMPYRGTREHVEKIADRLEGLDDEPPEITYPVPS
jgi:hypothetical protein